MLTAAVVAQAALGIWTLLAQVPLALGLAHQAGAAAVFGLAVWHLHALRYAGRDRVAADRDAV
jgi:cytochrome c oxidase assembly protein subunit 15